MRWAWLLGPLPFRISRVACLLVLGVATKSLFKAGLLFARRCPSLRCATFTLQILDSRSKASSSSLQPAAQPFLRIAATTAAFAQLGQPGGRCNRDEVVLRSLGEGQGWPRGSSKRKGSRRAGAHGQFLTHPIFSSVRATTTQDVERVKPFPQTVESLDGY